MISLIPEESLWTTVTHEDDFLRTCLTKRVIERDVPDEKLLVINSISGAVDVFDRSEWELIKECALKGNFESLQEDLYSLLVRRGYLYFDEKDEDEAFIFLMQYYRSKPKELQNCVVPTLGCNFNCIYCFQKKSIREDASLMNEDQMLTAQQIIRERVSVGENRLVRIFGGEPLQPQNHLVVEELFRFAATESLTLQFTTNGFHLLDFIPLFEKYREVPLYIQVTLDGVGKTHDVRRKRAKGEASFEQIVRGIDALVELPNTDITVRHNVDKKIAKSYSEVIKFIKEKDWHSRDNIQFQISGIFSSYDESIKVSVKPDALDIVDLYDAHILNDPELDDSRFVTTSFSSEASYLASLFNFHVPGLHTRSDSFGPRVVYCHAAMDNSKYVFSPDGYIYNCLNLVGNSRFAIGRYADGQTEMDSDSISRWEKRSITNIRECRDCELASLCGGGCPVDMAWKKNEIMGPACNKQIKKALLDRYLDAFIKQKLPSLISASFA